MTTLAPAHTPTPLVTAEAAAVIPRFDVTDVPGRFVAIHVLHTLSGVNLNSDEDGLPKSITIGGVPRMRVSAQCLARAIREDFADRAGNSVGVAAQTRSLPTKIAESLIDRYDTDPGEATAAGCAIVAATGVSVETAGGTCRTGALTTVPTEAADRLADLCAGLWEELPTVLAQATDIIAQGAAAKKNASVKLTAGHVTDAIRAHIDDAGAATSPAGQALRRLPDRARAALAPGRNAEICLFGRMLTELPVGGEVLSAVQIAHAFTVDPHELMEDTWSAVDVWQPAGAMGAANRGTKYFGSGTLYRYCALDRGVLRENLTRSGAEREAVEDIAVAAERLFVTSAATAMPRGQRSRTGSSVLPAFAVAVTTDRPYTAAAAFNEPVAEPAEIDAAHRLSSYLHRAHAHTPIGGGAALWLPGNEHPAPQLPTPVRVLNAATSNHEE